MTNFTSSSSNRSEGYALITALIFLVVLTLVALTATKSTTLELRMSANNAMRTEALEASEAPRVMVSRLVDVHTFNRGWPKEMPGGEGAGIVDKEEFAYDLPAGLAIKDNNGDGRPDDWFASNSESPLPFDPLNLTTDALFQRNAGASGQSDFNVASLLAVYKLRTDINPGAGAAMISGYEGTGKGAAGSGGAVFFLVQSKGNDPTKQGVSVTGADYRHVIRN